MLSAKIGVATIVHSTRRRPNAVDERLTRRPRPARSVRSPARPSPRRHNRPRQPADAEGRSTAAKRPPGRTPRAARPKWTTVRRSEERAGFGPAHAACTRRIAPRIARLAASREGSAEDLLAREAPVAHANGAVYHARSLVPCARGDAPSGQGTKRPRREPNACIPVPLRLRSTMTDPRLSP
jgi:hypothetical protein